MNRLSWSDDDRAEFDALVDEALAAPVQVSQPGMHGGASGLGYQLPSPVSAQQWVFGADGHLDWPHGAAVP